MYGRAILRRRPDGKLECVFPYYRTRGGTAKLAESRAILAEIKRNGRHFRSSLTRPKFQVRRPRISKDDSNSRKDARTCKTVLPASGPQRYTIGPRAHMFLQKQVTSSAETDDEDVSDSEDERPARNRGRETSESLEELSWMAELDEAYELRESLKKRRRLSRRAPSPEPHGTISRGRDAKIEAAG